MCTPQRVVYDRYLRWTWTCDGQLAVTVANRGCSKPRRLNTVCSVHGTNSVTFARRITQSAIQMDRVIVSVLIFKTHQLLYFPNRHTVQCHLNMGSANHRPNINGRGKCVKTKIEAMYSNSHKIAPNLSTHESSRALSWSPRASRQSHHQESKPS